MANYGTDSQFGVPVSLSFSYDGTSRDWGSTIAHHVEPLSNRAESIDGNYQISDLDVEFIDTNGSLWIILGHGTAAFNKAFSLEATVGNGSNTFTVHQGKVTNVSKRNRLVRVKSKNNLRLVADLEWRFPYRDAPEVADSVLGSYYFFNSKHLGTLYPNSLVDRDEDRSTFEMYAAVATSNIPSLAAAYPAIAGRGTLGRLDGYHYPGTQFYFDQPRVKVKGSYLTTKFGTINTEEEARQFGYSGLAAAEAAKTISGPGPTGTYYNISRTRLHVNNGTNPAGSHFHFQQNLSLSESPANLFRELMCGHCVTPYFGTSDLEGTTFANAQLVTGFQSFVYKADPKGGKVAGAIKNLMESLYGLYSVNPENKFEFRPYAPRKIRVSPPVLGTSDILESSFENSIEDFYNRIVLKYSYDFDGGDFRKAYELKSSDWTHATDRPYEVESRFIVNENEAVVFANRLLRRFTDTVPRIEVETTLKYAGANMGSLYSFQDPDTTSGTKIVEIVGYKKDFAESRKVTLQTIDAEALYFRKGYAFWGTKATLPGDTVNSNSDSGWGTGGTAGTCPGINTSIHGSCFVWW